MFAPAWQTTARAGLRSKLAALVVRRQAPPNPRRGEVEAPLSKGDSPLRGEMSRSDRGARARRAGRVSGPGDSDGPYVTTRSRATTRQLGRGRAAALPCPSRAQRFTAVRRGRACPARDFAMLPVNGLNPSGLLRGHLP